VSVKENKALVGRFVEEVFVRGNGDVMEELVTDAFRSQRPRERWTRPWADPVAVRLQQTEPRGNPGASLLTLQVATFYLQTEEKAERVGFEPTRRLQTAYAISSRAPSANSDTSP
jgi:hypothetical protein